MSLVQIILVVIVAFIIGCSSVNDQIETYQPVVACSLIGLVTGHLELGVMLGGSLQLITMGWANVGAAMAPDASLAAVASTIILILGGQGAKGIGPAIALAVPLAVAGLALTMFVRTATVFIATLWIVVLKMLISLVLKDGTLSVCPSKVSVLLSLPSSCS